MKMVFEGKSPRDLALQIMDYKRTPLSYKEFVAAWDEWVNNGGIAPR